MDGSFKSKKLFFIVLFLFQLTAVPICLCLQTEAYIPVLIFLEILVGFPVTKGTFSPDHQREPVKTMARGPAHRLNATVG